MQTLFLQTPSPESEIYGLVAKKPTRRPTPSQSKPDSMSMDFNMLYSKFKPVPKVHKMEAPENFSYQFTQYASGKSGKSTSKSSKTKNSAKTSGKSASNRSTRSKSGKEPVRNLRATLDEVDLDRGAKPSKRSR